MNELLINVELNAGTIVTNAEELKEQLAVVMSKYATAVFTEESKSMAKAELANLRKLRESVEKRRKEVKNRILQPYTVFEKETKELVSIIDKPIELIDTQLKEMEEERIRKKRIDIRKLYGEVVGEAGEYLPFDEIYDNKWDNAGTSMKKIREVMENMVIRTASDISIIQASPSDAKDEALDIYRKSRDLAKALSHINVYENNKKKVLEAEVERQRREEDRRRQEDLERVRAEERRKIEQETHICRETQDECGKDTTPFEDGESETLPFVQPTTVTAFYRVVATPEELENVEMLLNSLGIYFERRDA